MKPEPEMLDSTSPLNPALKLKLPEKDWLHPTEPDVIFDGSLLPGDPTANRRPIPENTLGPERYREWWEARHFFDRSTNSATDQSTTPSPNPAPEPTENTQS